MKRTPTTKIGMRSGATLTEVLVSLLIFSVGIVSVFTLFPVSLLSSIQATKLTNSKILSDNVVDLVSTNPDLLRPPRVAATDPWMGEWEPNTSYAANDLVWPRIDSGQLFPQPNLAYRCTNTGTSGGSEPNWPLSGSVNDGSTVTWDAVPLSNYVVDPLGRFIDGAGAERVSFGYNGVAPVGGLPRTDGGGFSGYTAARPYFTQPDSWTIALTGVPIVVTPQTPGPPVTPAFITFPPNIPMDSIASTDQRVVLVSPDGTQSITRPIATVSGQTINLGGADLPANLNSASEVGTVRVEVFSPRYSYILTVRRPDEYVQPKVSAVILFNRSFSFEDEEVIKANFGNSAYDDDAEVDATSHAPSMTENQVLISWAGKKQPLLREGNYIFDAREVLWYQMSVISIDATNERALITLERAVEEITVDTGMASDVGRAIFLPGIVEIFEL